MQIIHVLDPGSLPDIINGPPVMQSTPETPPVIGALQIPEALTPVTSGERIETLDVLRGIALFGILVVNMVPFGWPLDFITMGHRLWETPADKITDGVLRFAAEGKFYPLFSFLFGLGVAIQIERAELHHTKFGGRYCRRLFVLLGIGLVHALLVWEGDILVWYALCGFLLLAFQKCKPRTLLIWAAIFLLIPALLVGLLWALLAMASLVPEIAAMIRQELIQDPETAVRHLEESIRVYAVGSYGEIFLARLGDLIFMWLSGFFFAPTFLGMFLVGLYAGRRRIFKNVTEHVALLRRVLGVGLAVGVPANLFYTFSVAISGPADVHFWWLLGSGVVAVGGPVLAGAYVAAITLLLQRGAWKMVLHPFAAAGQMALSNYLLQSLVCTSIFYSYGLGLFGSVGRMVGLGLAVIIFGAQVLLSTLWLKFFRNGPMEWLWRSLTYGKRQPLRR